MTDRAQVIVGASHAGVSLALQLRREGWEGPIQLVGAEKELPYHRPPLSKELLSGQKELDAIRLRPEKIYADNDIELLLGTTALKIDKEQRSLHLHDGRVLQYANLALCTGAKVRQLPLALDSERVLYLRTAADVAQLQALAQPGKHAVIIGGGYIGLEAAAVLRKMELEVTVLEMAPRVLARVTSEVLSDYLTSLHMMHGVSIKTSTQVNGIQDHEGKLQVVCNDNTEYLADFVLVGIGVGPNTTLAETAGVSLDDGIVVDEQGCTSVPHIFAAGDCTRHPNRFAGGNVRLESVQNANDQARVVAANMVGKASIYDAAPWFWSDQYDIKLQMAGLNSNYDSTVTRGDPTNAENEGFCVFYLRAGELVAVDSVARPKEFMAGKQLIARGITPDKANIADEQIEPASWLKP
ncbi:MAG TPA: pyridine nucleotide-disulfide oxidoreductase [Gammaproteobacteria bacterium]|nr:pyridine nucleotide-disulfide oxidoreductase [Gammaproteobacteria bacterium]HAU24529.1 pyridine nucleotide-disulfide oxidoreductase [Gammaproteobacteria bacterium]|tara:strand:- start:21687 stop:22916 length:1230 start_codon:yes stop_codon:yes gene_type:complete